MSYRLYLPETVSEAISVQKDTDGKYLAGGTVSLVNYHRRREIGDAQISLDRIRELRGIILKDGVLSVGGMTTMDDLERSDEVRTCAHALWQAASEVGGPQIRNRATLGGNIAAASPSSDCAAPLLAMNAVLNVQGAEGCRRIPVREFFLGRFRHVLKPDEIIVTVDIPVREDAVSVFRKVGKRSAMSVSCLNMAIVRTEDAVDVSVGAAAPRAVWCGGTSAVLTKDVHDIENAEAVLQTEISPIDDRWASASYRRTVCNNLLRALLKETEEQK